MHPYRVPKDRPEPPPLRLPLRSILPATAALSGLALFVAGLNVAATIPVLKNYLPPHPTGTAPPIRTFDVGELLHGDAADPCVLQDQTVIVRGVLRARRHDSFLHEYVEIGTGVGWEVPLLACYLADPTATTPPAGTPVVVSAQILGRSMGVALEADGCVPVGGRWPSARAPAVALGETVTL